LPRDFVEITVLPGQYLCDFTIPRTETVPEEVRLHGSVTIVSGSGPLVEIHGDLPGVTSWPGRAHFPRIIGHLQNNMDIVLEDAILESVLPKQSYVICRVALVGLGIRKVEDQLYRKCRVQLTGLDAFFGRAPLDEWTVPQAIPFAGQTFSARATMDAAQSWDDDAVSARCSYDLHFDGPPHGLSIRFFPIVTFSLAETTSILDWFNDWVEPLLAVASLATGRAQSITWMGLTVEAGASDGDHITAQVFGHTIGAEPYASSTRLAHEYLVSDSLVFSLYQSGLSLPAVLIRWRELSASQNPFPELFQLVVSQPDLPERARYLYLIQALEGLHGYENNASDELKRKQHEVRRDSLIAKVKETLGGSGASYLSRRWSKRPMVSLETRILGLLAQLPPTATDRVKALTSTGLAARLPSGLTPPELIRQVRNDLAHGNQNFDARELAPWTGVLEQLARAHMLRLLGCPVDVVARAVEA
jgi:hypothetical protein